MKNFKSLQLAGLVSAIVAFAAGCTYETGPSGGGGGYVGGGGGCSAATVDFSNTAPESVNVVMSGPSSDSFPLSPSESFNEIVTAGTYTIRITGVTSGIVYEYDTVSLGCGSVSVDKVGRYAELDLTNSTADDMWVYVDGNLENLLLAGDTAQYLMGEGSHQLKLEDAKTGYILWDDAAAGQSEYFAAGTIYPFNVTATQVDPIIALSNDMPLGSDCVTAAVDGVAVNFSNSIGVLTPDVCPGEVGYFSVYEGPHTVDFYDATTASFLSRETSDYRDFTTTAYSVK